MNAPALALLLTLGAPEPATSDVPVPTPAVAPRAASGADRTTPELHLPRGGLDAGSLAAPAVLLAGLGAAALVLKKRRRPAARRVQVLETTSIGPKRALVLARLGDELLLLGSSEAGIALLHSRAAGAAAAPEPAPLPPNAREVTKAARETPADAGALGGLVSKLRRVRPGAAPEPAFDALLAESAEDQELRRKLARGQAGSIR